MIKYWHRLSAKFTRAKPEGQLVLSQAYRDVFRGKPSIEQQQMVLADLAAQSGFYQVTHESASSTALAYREGKRALYGVIFGHLSLSPDDMAALENAARWETLDNSKEQDF